jgi:hypothetical protein
MQPPKLARSRRYCSCSSFLIYLLVATGIVGAFRPCHAFFSSSSLRSMQIRGRSQSPAGRTSFSTAPCCSKVETSGLADEVTATISAGSYIEDERVLAGERERKAAFEWQQKLESGKAATLGAAVGGGVRAIICSGAMFLPVPDVLSVLSADQDPALQLMIGTGVGIVEGALFGLTYRYVVRQDRQPSAARREAVPVNVGHMGDGAVGAFSLVTALGGADSELKSVAANVLGVALSAHPLTEVGDAIAITLPVLARLVAAILVFGSTRAILDACIDKGLLKQFP